MGIEMREIYLIGTSRDGPLKIGVSDDADTRLRSLQTGNHRRLQVFWRLAVWGDAAEFAERKIHSQLADRRIGGEWFDVPIEHAISVIWMLFAVNWDVSQIARLEGSHEQLLSEFAHPGTEVWSRILGRNAAIDGP